jgi:spore germination protein YaaH
LLYDEPMEQRKSYSIFIFILLLTCVGATLPQSAFAITKTTQPSYTRLFYAQGGTRAAESFMAHPETVDIYAPQTYGLDETGLSGKVDPAMLSFAKNHGIRVMPLVTNKAFRVSAYKAILDDPTKQAAAIDSLINEARQNDYWGWQIDFEQMDASYKDKFSSFVRDLHTKMQANDLKLSVAVVSKISDNPNDYPKNLWQNLIGVYDFDAIAKNSDFVSVMSYDDPNSKGPVVEYSWLQKVIAYSLMHIPKEKISLGIPLYYWQWSDTTGKRIGIGGNKGIQTVLSKHKVALHYDSIQKAPYMTYWSHAASFTIWYENAKSISEKIALIKSNGLYGFSAWALGLEQPDVYVAMKK